MQGEIVHFRKKFFGGFNRDDVAAYITKISKERNEGAEAAGRAEEETAHLKAELEHKKAELEHLQKELEAYKKLVDKMKQRAQQPASENLPGQEQKKQKSVIIIKRNKLPIKKEMERKK